MKLSKPQLTLVNTQSPDINMYILLSGLGFSDFFSTSSYRIWLNTFDDHVFILMIYVLAEMVTDTLRRK